MGVRCMGVILYIDGTCIWIYWIFLVVHPLMQCREIRLLLTIHGKYLGTIDAIYGTPTI